MLSGYSVRTELSLGDPCAIVTPLAGDLVATGYVHYKAHSTVTVGIMLVPWVTPATASGREEEIIPSHTQT